MFSWLIRCFTTLLLATTSVFAAPEVSLRDKIGQMLMFGFSESEITAQSNVVDWINEDNIGGVLAFNYDEVKKNFKRNILTRPQVKALNAKLQFYTQEAARQYHRPHLPLLIAIDYEGGNVDRLATAEGFEPTFPAEVLAQLPEAKRQHELQRMVDYLKTTGFNLDLAPIVDVKVNPHNPIIAGKERSFSEHPEIVAHDAKQFIDIIRANHLQCALKHFPGHGSSTLDSHLGFVDVSKTWKPYELLPYQLILPDASNCGFVMTAHVVNRQLDASGLPATLSYTMLTKLLRQYLHFKGVIISDDMQMEAISKQYALDKAVTLAINAGVDLLVFANQTAHPISHPRKIIDMIEAKVKSGEISTKRIDEAYERIQRLKKMLPRV